MTAAAFSLAAPSLPRVSGRLAAHPVTTVLGVAAGAVGAAVLTSHAALPDVSSAASSVTHELSLTAGSTPTGTATGAVSDAVATGATSASAAVTPVSAEPTSAASTVPELTRAATRQRASHQVEAAIDRFESHIGSSQYEEMCELAVENAFGVSGRYPSAIDDWHSQDQHTDFRNAPRGAMVFYNTSGDGHIALSLGDGRVVTSSAHGAVGIVPIDYFQNPLGWAYAPYVDQPS